MRVVLIAELKLDAALGIDLFNGDLGTVFGRVAINGGAAGQGAGTADLDGSVGIGGDSQREDHRENECECEYFLHVDFSFS